MIPVSFYLLACTSVAIVLLASTLHLASQAQGSQGFGGLIILGLFAIVIIFGIPSIIAAIFTFVRSYSAGLSSLVAMFLWSIIILPYGISQVHALTEPGNTNQLSLLPAIFLPFHLMAILLAYKGRDAFKSRKGPDRPFLKLRGNLD